MAEQPEEFEDVITIVWPRPGKGGVLPGWNTRVLRAGGTVPSVTGAVITVHLAADSLTWAELTMFADPAGRPSWDGTVTLGSDGEPVTRTYPFLIAEMQVEEVPGDT